MREKAWFALKTKSTLAGAFFRIWDEARPHGVFRPGRPGRERLVSFLLNVLMMALTKLPRNLGSLIV